MTIFPGGEVDSRQILATGAAMASDGRRVFWRARRFGVEDEAEAAAFRAARFAELPDPDWYVPEVPEFLRWHLSGERGLVLGLYIEQDLAAITILGAPQQGWPCFAADLPDLASRPEHTAHLASTMVAPAWRGFGLQKICVDLRVMLAVGLGRPHLLARVAVGNAGSWRNMLRSQLVMRRIIVMHTNKLRYLLHRDLTAVPATAPLESEHFIALDDYKAQEAAFSAGYCVRCAPHAQIQELSFTRL